MLFFRTIVETLCLYMSQARSLPAQIHHSLLGPRLPLGQSDVMWPGDILTHAHCTGVLRSSYCIYTPKTFGESHIRSPLLAGDGEYFITLCLAAACKAMFS